MCQFGDEPTNDQGKTISLGATKGCGTLNSSAVLEFEPGKKCKATVLGRKKFIIYQFITFIQFAITSEQGNTSLFLR